MGTVNQNPAAGSLRGKIGGLVYVKYDDGRTVVRRLPIRVAPWTAPQIKAQFRFQDAVAFVKGLPAHPELRTIYQRAAKVLRKRACDLAIADFLSPPHLGEVDLTRYSGQPDEPIAIEVLDDFQVASVEVEILDLAEVVLEAGPASLTAPECNVWLYRTKVALATGQTVTLLITAADWSGNSIHRKFDHVLRALP